MLEIVGKGYVMEHCISFFRKRQEEKLFKNYVADAMRIITYNTSKKGSGVIEQRYSDILESLYAKKETRTEKEIVNSISNKLRKMSEE